MILVVAEKPSVARDIARVLGCRERGQGYLSSKEYTITWALGHLVTLCEPDEIDARYKRWRMEDLPILPETLPTKVISKTRSQYSVVKGLMLDAGVARIICATDAGREGELIFRLIYEKAGCRKPVDRLWISSLTDAAIREGFEGLKPGSAYDGLYQSALCRSQADWLVGMNASRAFTLKYDALLSVGRVQTPTLALLVKRAQEIRGFVPERFFTATADFGDYQGKWFDPKNKDDKVNHRIPDKETAESITKSVSKKGAQVSDVTATPKRELPPQLFDLTTLQRDANRKLGFTAARTLKTAQVLYETHKCITYPRTDSRYLPRDMMPQVVKTLSALPEPYRALADAIPRKEGKLPCSGRIFDNDKVSDHHAIIPTGKKPGDRMTRDEAALYDLVARRLIAAFYPAFEYDQIRVVTEANGEAFKSNGRVVKELGWRQVEGAAKGDETDQLPELKAGDTRQVNSAKVKEEATKPPPNHTDASLLYQMEHPGALVDDESLQETLRRNGLGTPATRAAIIERLITVGYAARRGKAIEATDKGEKLIAVVPEEIASPEMTGRWEQALEEIAASKREPERFMVGIRRLTAFLVESARKETNPVQFEREQRGKGGRKSKTPAAKALEGVRCPLCGKAVQENSKAFGCSDWKAGCRFTLWKNALLKAKGPMLNERLVKTLLTDGSISGSTGTIRLGEGMLSFYPAGAERPALSVPIGYEAKKQMELPKKPVSSRKKKV
ncbi:MAG: DNA topoisomerase III [Eubacteriales bacterium]|nr:DNA topoisomerase III [Eubacteriales bacterium]